MGFLLAVSGSSQNDEILDPTRVSQSGQNAPKISWSEGIITLTGNSAQVAKFPSGCRNNTAALKCQQMGADVKVNFAPALQTVRAASPHTGGFKYI
jgi:hypothetical protein